MARLPRPAFPGWVRTVPPFLSAWGESHVSCTCLGVTLWRGEPGTARATVGITHAEGEEIQSLGRRRESMGRGIRRRRDVVLGKDISDARC